MGKGEVTKEIKEAPKLKRYTDLSNNLDKVLGVLGVEALYLASAGLQGGSMGHKQDRVSCVKEVENIESHSSDTISFLSQTKPFLVSWIRVFYELKSLAKKFKSTTLKTTVLST